MCDFLVLMIKTPYSFLPTCQVNLCMFWQYSSVIFDLGGVEYSRGNLATVVPSNSSYCKVVAVTKIGNIRPKLDANSWYAEIPAVHRERLIRFAGRD